MSSSTIVRRSSRTTKQVSYISIIAESSDEEDKSHEPIAISEDTDDDTAPDAPVSKRKRVSNSKPARSSRPTGLKKAFASLDVSGPFEASHSTSRHDPQRLLPHVSGLLNWFEEKRDIRGMPWRKVYDSSLTKKERGQRAYEVLVSEIMLQQTQVATVIPYYNRWLEKFPTLDSLAAADLPAVHALWKGLGYYRRAGFLLAAAKKVKEQYGGCIPEDVKIMQKEVPGMGRYTAGAVASIAYGIKAPVLDGNVQRLLSRALAVHANPKSKQTLDILWGAASTLVNAPESSNNPSSANSGAIAGNINQALIELGSTVCRPMAPSCGECPLSSGCAAYELVQPAALGTLPSADIEETCIQCDPLPVASSSVTRFPMKVEKKKARIETSVVCPVQWTSSNGDEWWLMTKRPATGLLAGLWEFPTLDLVSPPHTMRKKSESSDSEVDTSSGPILLSIPSMVLPKLLNTDSMEAKLQATKHIGNVLHIFSHIHKTYEVVCSTIQWHGDQPPELGVLYDSKEISNKGLKSKRKRSVDQDGGEYALPVQSLWVAQEEVMNQNVGVGTKKIWQLMVNKKIL